MNRETLRDFFPESAEKEWRWIDYTLADLTTSMGLSAESQRDGSGSSQSLNEIVHTLNELQRHLQALFAKEAKWWSEFGATPTSCERQASLQRMADKRRTLLQEVDGLLEASKFVATGFEWEELASSVNYFRTRIAEYRALEIQVARSLKQLAAASDTQGSPNAATTAPGKVEGKPATHLHVPDHGEANQPRRRPRPR